MASQPEPTAREVAGSASTTALLVISICQLMLILDSSIMNIALPHAQTDLGISDTDRQWVVTAYTIGFGGLLLLGGRIADFMGRRRILVIGLLGFALASALGGLTPNAGLLYAARGLQGAFAAVLAPATLSLLSTTFTEPKARARAFAVYGGISGGGAAVGLLLGGVLTEFASWRWCLLVMVPIASLCALAATRYLAESRAEGEPRYDVAGAVTATLGLIALVYGFTLAGEQGWRALPTVGMLTAAVVLIAVFFLVQSRIDHPMLPLRILNDRVRGGAFLASILSSAGLFSMFLFLTYHLQGILHYSALKAGLAFLPISAGVVAGAAITSAFLPRVGPRLLMVSGMVLATAGLLLLSRVEVGSSFLTLLLPAEIVASLGMGLVFVTVTSTAMIGVHADDTGVASALVNTTQQVGGSLGTALLNTVAAGATAAYLTNHALPESLVQGYRTAFLYAAVILLAGAVAAALMIRTTPDRVPADH